MSTHIGAEPGQIAKTVLFPGDRCGPSLLLKIFWMMLFNTTQYGTCSVIPVSIRAT